MPSTQPTLLKPNGPQADIEFEKELWEAAVSMRGNVAPADYKHYVLPLIFLRFLSLKYERRKEELGRLIREPQSEYFTNDPEIAAGILEDEDEYRRKNVFVVPETAGWEYLVAHAADDDIKLKLDQAMEKLETAYPNLRGILPKIYAGSNLPRESVTGLINLFSRDIFKGEVGKESDVLGRVYEYFITNFASTEGTRGGEFFTPGSVVKLLVAMLAPERGSKIFDPACGSGGMFVQSARFTHNGGGLSFYGQETIDTTIRLGKMNMILHGIEGDIRMGNSLLDDKHPDLKADFVLANPPFNLKEWGASRISPNDKRIQVGTAKCLPTDSNANYFWIQHFLYHLAEGGTAGFVMANGSMTTSQTQEQAARIALVDNGFVDCIVQLPDKLFIGTGIPACLWFLSKNRNGRGGHRKRDEEILFIDAREKGEMVTRRLRVLPEAQINDIAAIYHNYRNGGDYEDIPGFCAVAKVKEVQANGYKLTPGIYVGLPPVEEDGIPFAEKMEGFRQELTNLFAQANQLQAKIVQELENLYM